MLALMVLKLYIYCTAMQKGWCVGQVVVSGRVRESGHCLCSSLRQDKANGNELAATE
jgi:hypothetical protein